ncbi:ribosomal L7Ae/L30e/S12e/Gadd45 family protein [Clostridium tagluense]|uniref:ribosomal L7Ae/L30e/S12e/Gadd45 family protein n=1 Tax=Clostridium tagluense TaxID=360422 RepID=UPI001CF35BA2|nr:ribosomal L7Ae/L30e/S12e/Gadd45 family protein [Clostridium tagluense]MCB2299779.1 ribosomal L7Ae/L30e/S12e/Gadd45 family protein [Clostridium tagluense]
MNNKFFQFLGLTKKAGKLIEGYNQCEEALSHRRGTLIIMSQESATNTKDKFKRFSIKNNIPLIEGVSNEVLGNCLGRAEINVLCVSDKRMSDKLLSLWNESSE